MEDKNKRAFVFGIVIIIIALLFALFNFVVGSVFALLMSLLIPNLDIQSTYQTTNAILVLIEVVLTVPAMIKCWKSCDK